MRKIRFILFMLCMLINSMAHAYHFSAVNSDGVTIYYNIIGEGCWVTYKNSFDKYSGEVNIPSVVTHNSTSYSVIGIGYEAFKDCSGLTSIRIPESVTSIEIHAFSGCSEPTSIVVAKDNEVFDSRDNCNAIIIKSTNTLIWGCKSTAIPKSVTSIGSSAFNGCSGLTSITIPNSVTSIGAYAFNRCSGLTSITIPNSVTSIGNDAFSHCSGLTAINIPNSVTSIGDYAFSGCRGLTAINIPNSVTSIGSYAFCGCYGLTSITIPNSVTSTGSAIFEGCNLFSITLLNSIKNNNNFLRGTRFHKLYYYGDEELRPYIGEKVQCHVVTDKSHLISLYSNNKDIDCIYAEEGEEIYVPVIIDGNAETVHFNNSTDTIFVANINETHLNANTTMNYGIFFINGDDYSGTNGLLSLPFTLSLYHKMNHISICNIVEQDKVFVVNVASSGNLINQINISNINNIEYLKVTGNLNGTDILVIRRMENLRVLDMSDANIVNGGSSYYKNYTCSEGIFGDYILDSKHTLEAVFLPKSITKIGNYAFNNCINIRKITIHPNITQV